MKLIVSIVLTCVAFVNVFGQKLRENGDGYTLKVAIDQSKPIYQVKDVISGRLTLTKNGNPVQRDTVIWIKSKDNYTPTAERKMLIIKQGVAEFKAKLDEPGFVLNRFNFKTPSDTLLSKLVGVAVNPLDIKPSMACPVDFDSYWESEKRKQELQPLEPWFNRISINEPDVEVYDVQANSLAGPFSAYMARPLNAKPNSLPAMILFHGAGVASSRLSEVIRWAKEGVCVIDFNVHGLANGQPTSYYKELYTGPLKKYFLKGMESRDSLFFRSMILRVFRALEIITMQSDWDGKNLIAFGRSQGGGQAIIAAGMDPRVNLLCAEIPALCDHTGNVASRVNGWPKLMGNGETYDKAALQVVPYVDAINFAQRTNAKAYVTVGFIDLSSPPTSVYAMYNQLKGEKHILNIYDKGHVVSPEGWEFVCNGVNDFLSSIKNNLETK
ncbi:hypothetical protein APS56_04770 [Pseudalgibacter alginicilyticus]|uniref:Acetyl xylan esterase domain-containing protein n=1 Tax=Pseudalgibacter alginicilyticus TaxID=1736674 RepID=A0A0N7HY78_9FLAO|nr:acetylxylan esterase [Pseudalgibacter alginicilyticus]ALJ04494.1 hypothetical protein APS56_04770 [Pseudalgibacter alginicilyticus]